RHRTRNQKRKLQELTAIQRNVLEGSLIDDLPERDRSLQQRHVGNHIQGFGDIADLQVKVLDDGSSNLNDETRDEFRTKTARPHFAPGAADRPEDKMIATGGV